MAMKSKFHKNIQTMKWSAWLGWQMESNWTNPFKFLVYTIARPIASTLILVVMYLIITGGITYTDQFHYIYISNAFFMYVFWVLFGITWVIHDDREHFQTMKYIYISPSNYFAYMIGRSITKIIVTTFSIFITLAFGYLFLDIPLSLTAINWPLFLGVMIIGLLSLISFGLALAGVSFLTAKHSGGVNESIAGIFYLFCGVVFPVHILPVWAISFSKILPITYWLELVRRSLNLGVGVDTALAGISTANSLIILCVSTIIFTIIAFSIFFLGDHLARSKGLIDMTTAY